MGIASSCWTRLRAAWIAITILLLLDDVLRLTSDEGGVIRLRSLPGLRVARCSVWASSKDEYWE